MRVLVAAPKVVARLRFFIRGKSKAGAEMRVLGVVRLGLFAAAFGSEIIT